MKQVPVSVHKTPFLIHWLIFALKIFENNLSVHLTDNESVTHKNKRYMGHINQPITWATVSFHEQASGKIIIPALWFRIFQRYQRIQIFIIQL